MILNEISEALQAGNARKTKELVQQAIDENISVQDILTKGLIDGMNIIGSKFRNNEIFIPEVLISARAMNQSIALLKPLLESSGVKAVGKVCIGTVQGDLHDIGKNLVKLMLESKGLEVLDLGTDVSAEKFINEAVANDCSVICCSALLTTTRPVMGDVVKARDAAGLKDKVKIMIGGAAVNQEFCDEIGADYFTDNATSAAEVALSIVS